MSDEFSGWSDVEIPDAGGKFFKFQTNQIYKIVLVGKPELVTVKFSDGDAVRLRTNMVELSASTVPRVVEFSPKVAGEIKDVFSMAEGGQGTILSVKKTGEGFQTKYVIVAGKPLTDEQKAKLGALELHDLREEGAPAGPTPDADEDMPF